MAKPIKHFGICKGSTAMELATLVDANLNDGLELHGFVFIETVNGELLYHQAMVTRKAMPEFIVIDDQDLKVKIVEHAKGNPKGKHQQLLQKERDGNGGSVRKGGTGSGCDPGIPRGAYRGRP